MTNDRTLRPFQDVIKELVKRSLQGWSGCMYIFSDRKNVALFELEKGKIIDIIYRSRHGIEMIPAIKEMTMARFHFNNAGGQGSRHQKGVKNSSNEEIFKLLGVESVNAIMRELTKILVVEDSGLIRKSIVQTLTENHYKVVEAKDGYEALAQLSNEQPDLVLLDLILPKIDGYEVLSRMKKKTSFKDIPVIVLTSRDTLFDKLKGKMSGSDEYLTKPFEKADLLTIIHKYLK